jgi:uroporphyrinogen decarboxylase
MEDDLSMNSRERIKTLLSFNEPDRIGLHDAYWEDTLLRWVEEGLPEGINPTDHFDFDFDNLYIDASLRLPEELLEDTAEHTIHQDKHGFITKMWKGKAGGRGYIDHSVKDKNDWEALKGRLTVDFGEASRIHNIIYAEPFIEWPSWEEAAQIYQKTRARGKYLLLHVYGPYEANWRKHGFNETLMDMVLNPDLLADMSKVHVDLVIETLEKAAQYGIKPDGLFVVEDMGVNTGPMFSPAAYKRVLYDQHRRLGDYLQSNGIAFFMHTDGDIRMFIPMLIEAGVQVLQPLEARAGLDVRKLKAEYGKDLSFMGNISVEKMSASESELEHEVRSKLEVAMRGGGYIYHSDHSVPSLVSLKDYEYLITLLKKYGRYSV